MQSLIMQRTSPLCWMLMPVFTERIRQFDRTYCLDGNASNIASMFETAFATGDQRMLGILLVEPNDSLPRVVGHIICGVDIHHGVPHCVIYQYEKDLKDEDMQATNDAVQLAVDTWALSLGQNEVMALATSDSRAKHFGRWGYEYASTLVTRRIGDGR